MTNEIKEIIEDLKNKDISVDDLTHNDKVKLIDYITNLQEKIKEADEAVEYWQKQYDNLQRRIDKAIEYLEQPYRDNFDYSKAELLNILRGDE